MFELYVGSGGGSSLFILSRRVKIGTLDQYININSPDGLSELYKWIPPASASVIHKYDGQRKEL